MMNATFNRFFFILFYSIMILGSPAVWSSDLEKIKKIQNGVSLKNITFYDFEKNIIDIFDNSTDFYIVNFWASWCAHVLKK